MVKNCAIFQCPHGNGKFSDNNKCKIYGLPKIQEQLEKCIKISGNIELIALRKSDLLARKGICDCHYTVDQIAGVGKNRRPKRGELPVPPPGINPLSDIQIDEFRKSMAQSEAAVNQQLQHQFQDIDETETMDINYSTLLPGPSQLQSTDDSHSSNSSLKCKISGATTNESHEKESRHHSTGVDLENKASSSCSETLDSEVLEVLEVPNVGEDDDGDVTLSLKEDDFANALVSTINRLSESSSSVTLDPKVLDINEINNATLVSIENDFGINTSSDTNYGSPVSSSNLQTPVSEEGAPRNSPLKNGIIYAPNIFIDYSIFGNFITAKLKQLDKKSALRWIHTILISYERLILETNMSHLNEFK